jgi:hypothetical protein
MRGLGDAGVANELDRGVEQADVRSPLRVSHSELGPEEPAQGPFAGAGTASQPGQRSGLLQVGENQVAGFGESGVLRGRQRDGLRACPAELVSDDRA